TLSRTSLDLSATVSCCICYSFIHSFFFNDTAPTGISTLSLHDALPISICFSEKGSTSVRRRNRQPVACPSRNRGRLRAACSCVRSEEHTSELQSLTNLVCRLLLEKKKKRNKERSLYLHMTQCIRLSHNC